MQINTVFLVLALHTLANARKRQIERKNDSAFKARQELGRLAIMTIIPNVAIPHTFLDSIYHMHGTYYMYYYTYRALLIATLVLLPLLGLTWAFGVLTFNADSTAFAWLFTIFNSLQV